MANTFVPFNFAPKAIQVVASGGNYTIPANEFALVVVNANLTNTQGTVEIDNQVVFKSGYIEGVSGNAASPGNVNHTTANDGYGMITIYGSAAASNRAGLGISGATLATAPITMAAGAGQAVGGDTATPAGVGMRGYQLRNMHQDTPSQFWVNAGMAIEVIGGDLRAVIHRYDQPS